MTDILAKLFSTIEARKNADPASSYTAQLLKAGKEKIARKVTEEAREASDEIRKGDKERLAEESADVLYHLLVGWAATGVTPADVGAVLEKREGQSGIEEKNSRKK